MKVLIVGLGIQGRKRLSVADKDVVATVDPLSSDATYRYIEEVPLNSFDAALLCIPDAPKIEIITYLLKNSKHVLVEKPLFAAHTSELEKLRDLSVSNKVACYTAYNHRFEPHFVGMKQLIDSGSLGRIYSVKMFYGNGTARLVRDSDWRDRGAGVLPDLGSHLLDTMLFWLGSGTRNFSIHSSNRFENRAPDHVVFGSNGTPNIDMEVTLLSWRNHFYTDIFAENGTAHISSLCKWGPSELIIRERQLPSGRPNEKIVTLVQSDPTWDLEYVYFKNLCETGKNNIGNDIWINEVLTKLTPLAI
ncbi:Gfo/Idh/MocA family protein [Polynucleobacter sp. AP-Feld-500C-C5]|uniref:Gfo/Idh/MocA family protein n=1 Tax=Polynucleobacter sp. AP-Feld-500C-C5 TaxID=2576924 RepID=UPI001C0BA575|nr:Gfo/Idh/MocA family oxidoreductase [Polynucleobacter sp. AP-Feld-500C-C5]MBU3632867.1 Gfo/Idh/MocA family oxidoreductase [Polynucleobacter sp. AP-Feld-500C-C5]